MLGAVSILGDGQGAELPQLQHKPTREHRSIPPHHHDLDPTPQTRPGDLSDKQSGGVKPGQDRCPFYGLLKSF